MRTLTGLSFLLLLIECSDSFSKEYIIAPIPGTAACVEECEVTKMRCRDAINDQARQCRSRYRQQESEYDYCVETRGTFGRCKKPSRCPLNHVSKKCNEPYDQCFIACGGRIE